MSKSIVLAIVVAAVIISGISWYIAKDGILKDQTADEAGRVGLQTAK